MIVIERATRENYSEIGYLRANSDVAAAVRNGSIEPLHHLLAHGEQEGRSQIASAFMAARASYLRAKYARFKGCFTGSPLGSVRFLEARDAFPVALSEPYLGHTDYPAESANAGYGPFVEEIRANPGKNYIDLGCGFRNEVFENCLYAEVYPSFTADVVVAPDCSYPIASGTFDGIGCFAVLEHVTKPWAVVAEIHRMLKSGGRCFIAWPFLQPVHAFPSHYFNATREGLSSLFAEQFTIDLCRTESWERPDHTISWILGAFVDRLAAPTRERLLAMTVAQLIAQPAEGPFWTELLDALPDDAISQFACGNSLIATKK